MKRNFVFTSESVTAGHPDKLCDLISDAIVDRFLQQDPYSDVVAECAVATGILFVAARFCSGAKVDIPNLARQVVQDVGYRDTSFDPKTCSVMTSLSELPRPPKEPADERQMTDEEIDGIPAHNPVTVFGFACTQTPALMPLPIWLAHKLARQLTAARQEKQLSYLEPDGSAQVGVEYQDGKPRRIHSITLVASHDDAHAPRQKALREAVPGAVIAPAFRDEPIKPDERTYLFVNPVGPFVGGGPAAHSGLTGRKNDIDTYGEYSRHSGSALSGKCPGRIDRIGAYAARYAAKNVVAAGLAEECEVLLSYVTGLSRPVSIQVETFGTGRLPDEVITSRVAANFDFRPAALIREFNLRQMPSAVKGGFYRRLAAYGHVGRTDISLPWELTDRAAALTEG